VHAKETFNSTLKFHQMEKSKTAFYRVDNWDTLKDCWKDTICNWEISEKVKDMVA
jgi:hypothetical protein